MLNKEKINVSVLTLCSILKGLIGYYDLCGSVIKLLFIKYISTYPDKLPLFDLNDFTIDDYKKLTEFKRAIDSARIGKSKLLPNDVSSVLAVVDKCIPNSNVRLSRSVDDMGYFFEESNQTKILFALDAFSLEDDPETLKEIFAQVIEFSSNDIKMTGENTTNYSLRKLATSLLEINETDSLLNSYCGFSTLLLNVDKVDLYAGYDLNANNVQVSLMMALMLGFKNYSIHNDDFITAQSTQKYSKAFMDGPLGIKKQIADIDDRFSSLRDIEALGMYKTAEMLKDGGKAVFAVPGKILFSSSKGMVELRKYFIEEGLMSVIALPPLWQGAGVPTNLVVLEKGYQGDVTMIDAKDLFEKPVRKANALSEENLRKIVSMTDADIISNERAVVVRSDEKLLETWVPTAYLEKNTSVTLRTLEEIDSELEELYAELRQL